MRIIAGARKGLRLKAPHGKHVRPTSDRAREALMSVLGGRFDGGRVLDLCAGTGAVALEFLSRGVAFAVLVERDGRALACLRDNVASARMQQQTQIEHGDVASVLERLRRADQVFDWVFFDPPYDSKLHGPVLELLADGRLLTDDAEVIVESGQGLEASLLSGRWQRLEQRRYGAATFDRLRRDVEDNE